MKRIKVRPITRTTVTIKNTGLNVADRNPKKVEPIDPTYDKMIAAFLAVDNWRKSLLNDTPRAKAPIKAIIPKTICKKIILSPPKSSLKSSIEAKKFFVKNFTVNNGGYARLPIK